ncbi:matrixin family metalloprotease [bacterium]|nr:matrixin family metalloprotease [bacterium]
MKNLHWVKRMSALVICTLLVVLAVRLEGFVGSYSENGLPQLWFKPASSIFVSKNVINAGNKTIRYYIDQNAFSEDNSENELEAIRSAFDQWENIPGTNLHFEEVGFIEGEPEINLFDNTNMIFWEKDSTLVNGDRDDIRGSLGLTFRAFFEDFNLVEADMVFNGVERKWYADYDADIAQSVYVEAVALHEVGHMIGMEHATVGTSTMMYQAQLGINSQLSLSKDDIAFTQTYYPADGVLQELGTIQGHVVRGGEGIHGAVIILEDMEGNVIRGTISRGKNQEWNGGFYSITAIPPGQYQLRVAPLDAADANQFLLKGSVVNFGAYQDATTDFLPSASVIVNVTANETTSEELTVQGGEPAFRIHGIQPRAVDLSLLSIDRAPTRLKQGDQNVYVGVYGVDLPADANFTLRGSGISSGITQFRDDIFGDSDAWYIEVSVDEDATPGSRSFELRQGENVAYANGFIEIEAKIPDVNEDNFDDIFQRVNFTRWTAPSAGPDQDADGDGYSNMQEYEAGSDPNNPASTPRTAVSPFSLIGVELTESGAMVTFESEVGASYQLFSRRDIMGDPWEKRGQPVTAEGETTIITDSENAEDFRFYRIETMP